jgi:hypothetical protein
MDMTKKDLEAAQIQEHYEPSRFIEFVGSYTKEIIYAALILICLLFLVFKIFSVFSSKNEKDYFIARQDESKIFKPDQAASATSSLEQIVKNHPDLQSKYDGLIAQALLIQNTPQKALPYAERNLQRVKNDSIPLYIESTANALAAAQGDLKSAHAKALELKEKLVKDPESVQLYLYTLLRLSTLEEKLNLPKEEKAHLEEFLAVEKKNPLGFETFNRSLSLQGAPLKGYIQSRLNLLK